MHPLAKALAAISLSLLFLSIFPNIFAQEVNNYNAVLRITAQVNVSGSLNIQKESEDAFLEELQVNLQYYPLNDDQHQVTSILGHSSPPSSIIKNNNFVFTWKKPRVDKFTYGISSNITSINNFPKIKERIFFPSKEIEEQFLLYDHETEFIDITGDIRAIANDIVTGETDYYTAVHNLAQWVTNNIEYNLSTLTAETVQKSSWVLANRIGVCDELTNLFISMARSVGIPARFVSGVVYTNLNNDFGSHGWAEVYFPGYGWVPFDVTFAQYGWVDPSHIRLAQTADSGEPAVSYSWRSRGISIEPEPISITTKVLEASGTIEPYATLRITPLATEVGLDSFVPIEAIASNPYQFYLPLQISFTKGPGFPDGFSRSVLLRPEETKRLYFIASTGNKFEDGFIYTSKLSAETSFGSTAESELVIRQDANTISLEEAREMVDALAEKENKLFLRNIDLSCLSDRPTYYVRETINVNCRVTNEGNTEIQNGKVCLFDECKPISLNIADEKNITFQTSLDDGRRLSIRVGNGETIRYAYVDVSIVSIPQVNISLQPESVSYYESLPLILNITSNTKVKNVQITLEDVGTFELREFGGSKQYEILVNGKDLPRDGIRAYATYEDVLGKQYNFEENIPIVVTDVPRYARALRAVRSLFT
ncbi:transglutaminase domain-containing protein [Candidatus Woesearchaeota archaeon]|nr:transglutaminase domain-containing protein [Candidatus Woesearchaeota archaeon]